MIGYISGEIIFSDGVETIIVSGSGVGYQIYYNQVVPEGSLTSLYISHIKREDSEKLYGFCTFKDKKLFELLTSVKGVGPKSAYSLVSFLNYNQIINAIQMDQKKLLSQAPGIGPKAAAQIILDLSNKIERVKIYSEKYKSNILSANLSSEMDTNEVKIQSDNDGVDLMHEALLACNELGFKDKEIIQIAQKILSENTISKSEQLVHLVLKEI